ncbi:MAG TPA: PadR family transcriptional regulator [Methylomirabilota bacterium]|jgi:DNA-binding PadR family transcriptional regulator
MLRNFFLGFIKIHILHHAAQEPLYGLSLIEELRRHGYSLSPGTLYPILHGLAAAGYLAQQDRVVGGKMRKYYSITTAGRRALDQSRRQILELVREVLESGPSQPRGDRGRAAPGKTPAGTRRRHPK